MSASRRQRLHVDAARRDIDATMAACSLSIAREMYSGPWTLDPEAFPAPLRLVPRLVRTRTAWRVGIHRYDDEAAAVRVAEEFGSRARRVTVRRVPKGTAAIREALGVLAKCLAELPAWDDMERRRRAATTEWSRRGLYSGLAAWLPSGKLGGESIVVPVTYGGPR